MVTHAGRIVVGYDGSPSAGTAVEWAAAEASRRGAPLVVLTVADAAVAHGDAFPLEAGAAEAERIAGEGAERALKVDDAVHVRTQTHVARVVPALLAASLDAELLVIGGRGHGEVTGALLGSVAFAVTAHARCPVAVVRGGGRDRAGRDHPVVVGVEAWPDEEPALRFAARAAASAGAPLVVVSAYRTPPPWALGPGQAAYDGALDAGGAAVAAAREEPGLRVSLRIVEGPPAVALAEACETAALLVVDTHGGRGLPGPRLGSVSHAVLHDAPCPVAVVPQQAAPRD